MNMCGGRDSKWSLFAAKPGKEGAENSSVRVGEEGGQNTAGFVLVSKQGRVTAPEKREKCGGREPGSK